MLPRRHLQASNFDIMAATNVLSPQHPYITAGEKLASTSHCIRSASV